MLPEPDVDGRGYGAGERGVRADGEAERSALRQQAATVMGMWMQRDFQGLNRATWPKERQTLAGAADQDPYHDGYVAIEQQYGRALKYIVVDVSLATTLSRLPFTRAAIWTVSVDVTGERGTYRLGLGFVTEADGRTYLAFIGQPGSGIRGGSSPGGDGGGG